MICSTSSHLADSILCSHSPPDRIHPPQPRKTREVPVRRAKNQPMFNRHRRQMRIRNQLRASAKFPEQSTQNDAMLLTRRRNPHVFARQPFPHLRPRLRNTRRMLINPRVRHHLEKSKSGLPGQSNPPRFAEPRIEPLPSRLMLLCSAIPRIDQKIGIHQNHFQDSPSASASTSQVLSRFGK